MAGNVTNAVVSMAAPAAAAAASTTSAAATAAPAIVAATRAGMSGTGWLGMGAGAAGLAITLFDTWKESIGSQKGLTAGALVTPTTMAIGGGAILLTLGEKTGATNLLLRNGMRGAGIALVLGGLAGAIFGALNTFGNPLKDQENALATTQSQEPVRFGTTLPPAPANLAGIEVASADVIGEGRKLERVPVYVDPATAKPVAEGASLGEAIGQARAAAQADESYRSHAVIETSDGKYWTIRLSGALDQVDGPKYSDGTKYDNRYDPQIGRRQQAIQAIAGVEGHFAFPEGMEATAPVQYTGDIPWVTPTLPGVKPAPPAAPATAATPAAPSAETTTPAPAAAGS